MLLPSLLTVQLPYGKHRVSIGRPEPPGVGSGCGEKSFSGPRERAKNKSEGQSVAERFGLGLKGLIVQSADCDTTEKYKSVCDRVGPPSGP